MGKITRRTLQLQTCFLADQFLERTRKKIERIEINALKTIRACTPRRELLLGGVHTQLRLQQLKSESKLPRSKALRRNDS